MRVAVCLLIALCCASAVRAQRVVTLPAASGTIDDDFTQIISLRELPEGRVVLADRKERRLVIADWTRGYTERIGRLGPGPGEYRSLRQLVALGPDSTLLLDSQERQLIVIVGADSLTSFPVEDGLRVTRFDAPIRGVDRGGRFVTYAAIPNPTPGLVPKFQRPSGSDSVLVLIANLWQPRVDTIARIEGKFRGRSATVRKFGSQVIEYELVNPFGVEEQAWMFPDGWMALALASPYRVDWRAPDGRWIRGSALPFVPVEATDEEKRAAMDRYAMHIPEPRLDPSDYPGWPDVVPPFPNDALFPLADGRIAIARMITHASTSQLYDIVDRRGALSARLEIPLNARIIAFGRESVYVITRDEFDLESLTRHPLPNL